MRTSFFAAVFVLATSATAACLWPDDDRADLPDDASPTIDEPVHQPEPLTSSHFDLETPAPVAMELVEADALELDTQHARIPATAESAHGARAWYHHTRGLIQV